MMPCQPAQRQSQSSQIHGPVSKRTQAANRDCSPGRIPHLFLPEHDYWEGVRKLNNQDCRYQPEAETQGHIPTNGGLAEQESQAQENDRDKMIIELLLQNIGLEPEANIGGADNGLSYLASAALAVLAATPDGKEGGGQGGELNEAPRPDRFDHGL